MKKTALYDSHLKYGAKIVEFAGYQMPVQYADGILKEHNQVRESAGLFDVSHMGQAFITGAGALEFASTITPTDYLTAGTNQAKYSVLTNKNGGIIDDLIITKLTDDKLFVVYNAGCKEKDEAHIASVLPANLKFEPLRERSLIALQGQKAEAVLGKVLNHDFSNQGYMTFQQVGDLFVSRLGYTGEDGFEISVPNEKAADLWDKILENPEVKPIGLGARDSLRLEMGYPLYGHDLNDEITPIEASLTWVVAKPNREKFPAPTRKRVGVEILDRGIVREGVEIFSLDGKKIGVVTSGGFSPTLQKPISQGYVEPDFAKVGTDVNLELRGRRIPAKIAPITFVQPKTKSAK